MGDPFQEANQPHMVKYWSKWFKTSQKVDTRQGTDNDQPHNINEAFHAHSQYIDHFVATSTDLDGYATTSNPRSLEPYSIHLLHFHAWNDLSIPSRASMQTLMKLVTVLVEESRLSHPIFIHCRAGVGRTGVLIALIYLTKLQQKRGSAITPRDVIECWLLLRSRRNQMVQKPHQVNLVYI